MNEFELHREAEQPLQVIQATFPGRRRRRIALGAVSAFVVVVLVVWAALFVSLNNRVHTLDRTTAAQAAQIHQLQSQLSTVGSSLSAAVACLQTVGSTQGLCSKLVKVK